MNRLTNVSVLGCLILGLMGSMAVGDASAAGVAAWAASSESVPTNLHPGGTGTIFVQPADVGSTVTDGSEVTVVDTLPPGLEATEAGETVDSETPIGHAYWDCTVAGRLVTCTNDSVNLPVIGPGVGRNSSGSILSKGAFSRLEAPEIAIAVNVAGGANGTGENSVRISGGGANTALDVQPVVFSASEAGFGITRFRAYATNEDGTFAGTAGYHPNKLTVDVGFSSRVTNQQGRRDIVAAGDAKNIHVAAPVGLVGDPQAAAKCTREAFDGPATAGLAPTCPVSSEVGYASLLLGNLGAITAPTVLPVYNLVPPPGVPAEFGFMSFGIYGTLDASLRTGGDYGITENISNTAQRALLGAAVTLWGVPADSSHDPQRGCLTLNNGEFEQQFGCASGDARRPFLSNATSCGKQAPWTISANSWEEPGNVQELTTETENSVGVVGPITGCELLSFKPTVTVQSDTTSAESPSGLNVDVHVPQAYDQPDAPAAPTVKKVTVALPAGMAISPSAANGLDSCAPSQIGLANADPVACPDASKIGSVEVDTPLLANPLHGSVFIAQQDENPFGSLLAIYVTAEGGGALIKLAGHVEADPVTGQLTTTVDNAPQLPFEDFKLSLFGGPRAPLVTPPGCGTYDALADVTPYSSTTPVALTQPIVVSSGCGGGFAPRLEAGSVSSRAGKFTGFTTTFSRDDGEQRLAGVQIQLPAGLLGELKNVTPCPEARASAGTCGADSLIGHSSVAAGPEPDPFWIGGQVFLTGPYGGAPFGLSILTHAEAGPFDLGLVNVRARIEVDRRTAQITVTSDPLPTILQGIPLDLRTINVSIDRPSFIFNPTDCSEKAIDARISSTSGPTVGVGEPFQATECASLLFKPSFKVSTRARTSKANGAALTFKIGSAVGQANLGKIHFALPKQLPARLTTLQKACTEAQFNANPAGCPAGSAIGTAVAHTPVLKAPLAGPIYLVSHGGAAFPDTEVVLQGEGVTIDLDGNTNIKKGITSSTFNSVPDAPISSFEATLPEGPHSAFAAVVPVKAKGSLCGQSLAMPTVLIAQNGAQITQTMKIAVVGCPKAKKAAKKRAKPHKQAKRKRS